MVSVLLKLKLFYLINVYKYLAHLQIYHSHLPLCFEVQNINFMHAYSLSFSLLFLRIMMRNLADCA